jgi:hypothetical protein
MLLVTYALVRHSGIPAYGGGLPAPAARSGASSATVRTAGEALLPSSGLGPARASGRIMARAGTSGARVGGRGRHTPFGSSGMFQVSSHHVSSESEQTGEETRHDILQRVLL